MFSDRGSDPYSIREILYEKPYEKNWKKYENIRKTLRKKQYRILLDSKKLRKHTKIYENYTKTHFVMNFT